MSLFITSLNSGSNGNCYYVGNEQEAILVDAGISCKEIEQRMYRLGLKMEKVKAIFISHEHSDHIKGLPVLAKRYRLPIYITTATLGNCRMRLDLQLVKTFAAHLPITVGGLSITAFPKFHDAADPYSFIISTAATTVGVFTDIGAPCEQLIKYFKQCHAAFLESNYDTEMLDKGSYPYFLKHRIRDGKGHLSNQQALELFTQHKPSFLSHLILSHLSKNNNCPKLVEELFTSNAGGVQMVVASRYEETPVFHINHQPSLNTVKPKQPAAPQLSFSFA